MIGKQTEERKWFTLEERKAIHKANYGICACCGKKLTVKSMTIFEHIFKQDILKYTVMTPYEDAIQIIFNPNASYFGESYRHGQIQDTENSNDVWYHIVEVMRRNILEEVANTLRTKST